MFPQNKREVNWRENFNRSSLTLTRRKSSSFIDCTYKVSPNMFDLYFVFIVPKGHCFLSHSYFKSYRYTKITHQKHKNKNFYTYQTGTGIQIWVPIFWKEASILLVKIIILHNYIGLFSVVLFSTDEIPEREREKLTLMAVSSHRRRLSASAIILLLPSLSVETKR